MPLKTKRGLAFTWSQSRNRFHVRAREDLEDQEQKVQCCHRPIEKGSILSNTRNSFLNFSSKSIFIIKQKHGWKFYLSLYNVCSAKSCYSTQKGAMAPTHRLPSDPVPRAGVCASTAGTLLLTDTGAAEMQVPSPSTPGDCARALCQTEHGASHYKPQQHFTES